MCRILCQLTTGTSRPISIVYWLVALAISYTSQTASAADVVGWRSDGKGEFQASSPPTRWSRDSGIAWKSPLPATSLSSPIVAGDRAFVMAEPNRLICISLSDGKLIWERLHEYEDVFGPEKAKQLQELHAQSALVQKEIAELQKELKAAEDAAPNSDKVTQLRDQIQQLQRQDEELTAIPPPRTDATGNTASTPVSDLKNVYAVLGNGIVSSHGHDGQRNWSRFVSRPMSRHSASPIIVGNLLIVHLKELVALDRVSGETVWKADTSARNGTSVTLTVGEDTLIVTPAGAVIRSTDGKILAKDLFNLAYSSPIVKEGVIFAAERGRLLAIRLSPGKNPDSIQTEEVWQSRGAQEDRLASPVIHRGFLFSVTGSGILDVVDIET